MLFFTRYSWGQAMDENRNFLGSSTIVLNIIIRFDITPSHILQPNNDANSGTRLIRNCSHMKQHDAISLWILHYLNQTLISVITVSHIKIIDEDWKYGHGNSVSETKSKTQWNVSRNLVSSAVFVQPLQGMSW